MGKEEANSKSSVMSVIMQRKAHRPW